MLNTMEEQGWCSCPLLRGATSPQVGLEGVIPTPCSLCPRCWDVGQRLGRRRQRTKGLTVPNSALSLPQPFLCTSHPVFRFQATYLSNLRGVTPRPRWLLPPPAQLSSQPPRGREEPGVDPRGVPLCCPSGTAPAQSSPHSIWSLCLLGNPELEALVGELGVLAESPQPWEHR